MDSPCRRRSYRAYAETLPEQLPSVDEILSSKEELSYGSQEVRVVRVRDHFVAKFGPDHARLQEGENQLFVQMSRCVRVPTVYAIFYDETTKLNFLIQEYIPGKLLDDIWGTLNHGEKNAIASQLRRYMDGLRAIPGPGYYGGIRKQPNLDLYFGDPSNILVSHPDSAISGSKATEEEWVDAMCRRLEQKQKGVVKDRPEYMTFLRHQYHSVFKGHSPVFNHGDFSPHNIMIRDDDKTVVIIDWEHSGWCPSFWEYCGAMLSQIRYRNDWGEWIPKILDEYHAELGWMLYHRTALGFY